VSRPHTIHEVSSSVAVECDIRTCWDTYTNNQLLPVWAPSVYQIECDSPTLMLGTIRKIGFVLGNKQGCTTEQCTTFEDLKTIDIRITKETFGFAHMLDQYGFRVSFYVDNDHTLLEMKTHYKPKRVFASIMSSLATREQINNLMSTNLQGFKSYIERT